MHQRFQDAMSIVQKFGKPDLFITMTCNPKWDEIKCELLLGQESQDRPDLLAQVFRSKFEDFKEDVVGKGVLGKAIAYVYVIEFQKRGLPHAHMRCILDDIDKVRCYLEFDQIVQAKIPNENNELVSRRAVLKHMISSSCKVHNLPALA